MLCVEGEHTITSLLVGWCIRATQGRWVKRGDQDSLEQLDQLAVLAQQAQAVLADQLVKTDLQVGAC